MIKTIKTIEDLKNRLISLAEKNDVVLITPHIGPDIDGVGSSIGLVMIMKQLGKEVYVVIDEEYGKLESGVKVVLNEILDQVNVVDTNEAETIMQNRNTLLITCDTNKTNLVPFDNFDKFNDILIVDHHEMDEHTIKTDNYYVNPYVSSTCEIVYLLMSVLNIPIDYSEIEENPEDVRNIANYLLGGIVLDTSKFKNKTSADTMAVVSNLMASGAKLDYAYSLFLDDFDTDIRISNLVGKSSFKTSTIAIDYNIDDPEFIYKKEDLAKAATRLIKYKNVDASFVIGFIEPGVIGISARSKGIIDVANVMRSFNGGGNETSAAARIDGESVVEIKEMLESMLVPGKNVSKNLRLS